MENQQEYIENKNVYDVLLKIVGIVGNVVLLSIFLFIILAVGYVVLVSGCIQGVSPNAAAEVKNTIMEIWKTLIPITANALSVISPIIVLLVLAGIAHKFFPAKEYALSGITQNLPSILAIVVILTICLLPILGMEIPNILGNIALVVVGYYFGKLKIKTDRT
jgi:hypothetical protein